MHSNHITVFKNAQFGAVRIYVDENGNPVFAASDVCNTLGLDKTATRRLDSDEKGLRSTQTPGGEQEILFVNESGLYTLVLGSRKPEAKAFKRWITHEVIPSIRKHGGYIAGQEQMAPEQLCLAAMEYLQNRVKMLEADNALQGKVIGNQTAKIDRMRPKALFADAVAASDSTILIGDLAKIIKQSCGVDTGQKRLFAWMRENGWLMKDGSSKNMPTQRAMDMGLFRVKETTISNPDGSVRVTKTTKVTGRGQQYFVNQFAKMAEGAA